MTRYCQYVIVAWVDPDAPNRSSKSPKYVSPVPTLRSMDQSTSFDVTVAYGQVVNAQNVVTTPASFQTFTVYTYVDPLTPSPVKGCSISVLRTDYKNSAKKKGLLVKCWLCLPDSNDVYTDEYLDNLLASWRADGSIEILEYLWEPGTNTHIASSILTLAESTLQIS